MNLLMITLLIIVLVCTYYFLLKNTVFGISPSTGNYLGFFIFYDLMIFFVPAILLLNIFSIEHFWVAFKVKEETVFWISCLILISLFLYFLSLKIISWFSKKYFYLSQKNIELNKNTQNFVRITVIVSLVLMLFAWLIQGVSHSFTTSFFSEISISTLRAEIKANSSVKPLKHLFIFITPLLTAIIASKIYNNYKIERVILLFLILFIASWGGSKGPLLGIFIVYIVSYATFNNVKINVRTLFKFLLFVVILLFLVYKVVLFQYPNLTDISSFLDYFTQRVFVAQLIGTYEEFNLLLNDFSYIWHSVPFASSFIDFPIFQKDLMMISEDRVNYSNIGIKNTFFIAEAYAMGDLFLLVISPFWTAINFSLTYIWMTFIINKFAIKNLEYSKKVVAISLFSYISITGGFSDLMFFKITIMITILIMPFLITTYVVNKIKNIRI